MSIHASERRVNVVRTLMVALAAASLDGALLVPDGDDTAPPAGARRWARVTCHSTGSTFAGRVNTLRATREDMLVTVECFARSTMDEAMGAVDEVDNLADLVENKLRYLDLPLVNYVADASGSTVVSGVAVRFGSTQSKRLPPSEGYHRRMVDAQCTYFSRHAG